MATLRPAEEERILRNRLITQTAVSKKDPPFRRLAQTFFQFGKEAQAGNLEKMDAVLRNLMREINKLEFEAHKHVKIQNANVVEQGNYSVSQQSLQEQIEQAKADIEHRKKDLEQARMIRQHNEEYEALRKLVMQHPKRSETIQSNEETQKEIEEIQVEIERLDLILNRRKRQHALLMHCIKEIKETADDDLQMLDSVQQQSKQQDQDDLSLEMEIDQ
eukprot:TRINITY_DN12757_c0_g1_i1.p2 TRINITY_DN12757_c0_g1~~TRINITY_DN12757_c0_g1_i1.p2  ORF type:complete len:218 (-),score=41.76 TRINITY_DN12757_c0_g1_i1:123-776(-)